MVAWIPNMFGFLMVQSYSGGEWLRFWDAILDSYVLAVYFDQRMHACTCVRMVKNDQKYWKMKKKVPFPSCVREAHVRRMEKNEEKSLLVSD